MPYRKVIVLTDLSCGLLPLYSFSSHQRSSLRSRFLISVCEVLLQIYCQVFYITQLEYYPIQANYCFSEFEVEILVFHYFPVLAVCVSLLRFRGFEEGFENDLFMPL